MVDLLDTSGGRIVLRDATDGHTVFDTDERLFTLTDRVQGSIAVHAYTARNINGVDSHRVDSGSFVAGVANIENVYNLASVNSAADTVRGAFSVAVSGGSQGGLTGLGYFNASGTYIHYLDAVSWMGSPGAFLFLRMIAAYTFECSGGVLLLRERIYLGSDLSSSPVVTVSVTLFKPTFTYNLAVGTWV